MLSDTLANGLESYRIGPKIRDLRQKKNMGLVQLGEHTGLSSGMLSKIERGQLFPTLPTLLRIAMVFGVGLEHFFVEDERKPAYAIVRRKDRLSLPDKPGATVPAYVFESLDFPATDRRMEAYFASFPVGGGASEPHSHAGAELIYVVRGQLAVDVGGNLANLDVGDAMYFDPSVPHTYSRAGKSVAEAIVVVVPD